MDKKKDCQQKEDRQTIRKNRQTNQGQSVERDHRVIFSKCSLRHLDTWHAHP